MADLHALEIGAGENCIDLLCDQLRGVRAPMRFTSITRRNTAGSLSQIGFVSPRMPALLMSASMRPNALLSAATAESTLAPSVISTVRQARRSDRPPSAEATQKFGDKNHE